MKTTHFVDGGLAANSAASWGWPHGSHTGKLYSVFVYGVEGWTDTLICDAVMDDFGNLVRVS